jgi:hypothetical protein
MAWNNLSPFQIANFTDIQTSGFSLLPGQSHITSNKCMTRSEIMSKYDVWVSNAYASNQIIPKRNINFLRYDTLYVGKSGSMYGYRHPDTGGLGSWATPFITNPTTTIGTAITQDDTSPFAYIVGLYHLNNILLFSIKRASTTLPLDRWNIMVINGIRFNKSDFTTYQSYDSSEISYDLRPIANPFGTTAGAIAKVSWIE